MMKTKLTIYLILLGLAASAKAETNLTSKAIELDLDKDGKKEYRAETFYRGTNQVIETIKHDKKSFVSVSVENCLVIHDDVDGDGIFETISVSKRDESGIPSILVDVFRRDAKGAYHPISDKELTQIRESSSNAFSLVTNAISAAKSGDTNQIEKVRNKMRQIDRKAPNQTSDGI